VERRRINKGNLITIISLVILVGTEIVGATIAMAYVAGSFLEFEQDLLYALLGTGFLVGGWFTWKFARAANRVEPIMEE